MRVDEVVAAVVASLEKDGWTVAPAEGRPEVTASRGGEQLVADAIGEETDVAGVREQLAGMQDPMVRQLLVVPEARRVEAALSAGAQIELHSVRPNSSVVEVDLAERIARAHRGEELVRRDRGGGG